MGTVALVLAGTTLIAGSQIQQGRIAKAQGDFARKIGERNQQALNRQAEAERKAAAIEEQRISRKGKIFEAAQRAIAGKSGGQIAGASLSVLADTAKQFALDRSLALRRGFIRSQELRQRGRIVAAGGRFAQSVGRTQRNAAFLSAGGSILATAGTLGRAPTPSGSPASTNIGTSGSVRLGISPRP